VNDKTCSETKSSRRNRRQKERMRTSAENDVLEGGRLADSEPPLTLYRRSAAFSRPGAPSIESPASPLDSSVVVQWV
jgi:hypothetical protein